MVYPKIIFFFLILIAFCSVSCERKNKNFTITTSEKNKLDSSLDSINSMYCYKSIYDSLQTKSLNKEVNNYFSINKIDLFKTFPTSENKYYINIENFYQNTVFSESYILERKNKQLLILVGQASGATGIGVDYWNYECLDLNNENKTIKFSSLAKTPYSVFFNNNELMYFTIDDNFPRPANGEEIKLDYYPLIGTLYDKNDIKINTINYNCYNK